MVEPSPPARHLLTSGDVGMASVGVKVEQEESSGGGRVNAEPPAKSPQRDWSGNPPLDARQLTPPLSRSPSVRLEKSCEFICERRKSALFTVVCLCYVS